MLFLPFDRKINDRVPWVIWGLMAVNVAVFILVNWFHSPGRLPSIFLNHGAIPAELHGSAWVTHLFLHANEGHLLGNMAFLLLFGMNVERKIGPAATLAIYLVSGFAALAAFAYFNPLFRQPLIGASGAISGVVGMYLVLFRRRVVDVLWWAFVVAGIVRLPALFVATFWFALEVLQAVLFNKYAEVAHWAHVGGFAAGYLIVLAGRKILPSHSEIYASVDEAPRKADRFEEKAYIPEAPAAPKSDGFRLVAREWKPLTSGIRRIVDGVLPGSGAFATASRIAAGLAPPQAEDLRSRLERAGFPVLIQPQEREVPSAPLVFIDALSTDPGGLVARDAVSARRVIEPGSVIRIQKGSTRGGVPILDIVTRDPWRRYRLSGATSAVPLAETIRILRASFPKLPGLEDGPVGFEKLSDLDEYFGWELQVAGSGAKAQA